MENYQNETALTKMILVYSYIVRIFRKENDGYLISKKVYNTPTFKDEFKFNPYEFTIIKKSGSDIIDPVGFGSKFIRHCKEVRSFTKNNDMTKFELNIRFKKNSFVITIINSKTRVVELKILVTRIHEVIEEKLYEYPKTVQDSNDYQPSVIESPVNFILDKEELIPVYRALVSGIEDMYINNWGEAGQVPIVKSVSNRLKTLIDMKIWNKKPDHIENVKTDLRTELNTKLNSKDGPHNPWNN